MDSERFDRLVKGLGTGTDRRRVLGMLAGSVAAVLGGRQATRAQGNSDCAASCKEVFGPGSKRGQCISACAKKDPCTLGSCPKGETCCEISAGVFACRLLPKGEVCFSPKKAGKAGKSKSPKNSGKKPSKGQPGSGQNGGGGLGAVGPTQDCEKQCEKQCEEQCEEQCEPKFEDCIGSCVDAPDTTCLTVCESALESCKDQCEKPCALDCSEACERGMSGRR